MKVHRYLFACLLICFISLAAESKTILVIESYHSEHEWDQSYVAGLEEVLGSSHNLVYFQMDTKRLSKDKHEDRAEEAWIKYLQLRPDLVILGDDNALRLLGPRFAMVNVPVVFLGINNNPRNYHVLHSNNITGVLERPLLKRSVLLLNDIISVKRVLILFDSGATAKTVRNESFYNKASTNIRNIEVDIAMLSSFSHWKQMVLAAKESGYDALLVGLYHTLTDEQGQPVDEDKVVTWTSKNTPVPPFGFWDFSVGKHKTIGGYVLFGKEQGVMAGQMALQILDGASAGKILPRAAPEGRFLFSRGQLAKWNINIPHEHRVDAIYVD